MSWLFKQRRRSKKGRKKKKLLFFDILNSRSKTFPGGKLLTSKRKETSENRFIKHRRSVLAKFYTSKMFGYSWGKLTGEKPHISLLKCMYSNRWLIAQIPTWRWTTIFFWKLVSINTINYALCSLVL
jgi:hypothetical protein